MIFMQFCITCLIVAILFVGIFVFYKCYLEGELSMGLTILFEAVSVALALGVFAFGGAL